MVEGRGTERKGDEAVVERYTEAEGDKNDERRTEGGQQV